MRQYNRVAEKFNKISVNITNIMLKTVVEDIPELCAVQDTVYQLMLFTGKEKKYKEYCSLLVSDNITHDDKRKSKSFFLRKSTNNNHNVYEHAIIEINDES